MHQTDQKRDQNTHALTQAAGRGASFDPACVGPTDCRSDRKRQTEPQISSKQTGKQLGTLKQSTPARPPTHAAQTHTSTETPHTMNGCFDCTHTQCNALTTKTALYTHAHTHVSRTVIIVMPQVPDAAVSRRTHPVEQPAAGGVLRDRTQTQRPVEGLDCVLGQCHLVDAQLRFEPLR